MARHLDLCNPGTLRAVARRVGIGTGGRLSQNFLVDRSVLDALVLALDPQPEDTVLEIGPGIGTLTGELLARVRAVTAVDIDPACIRATGITQHGAVHLRLVEADALRLDIEGLELPGDWLCAGNLPYHITTPLLAHIFETARPPRRGVFLVQREVARRLAADAGDWSLATVVVRSLAAVDRIADVPPQAFEPPPRVHSSIIRLHPEAALTGAARARVIALAKATFQMRRKAVRHGLAHAMGGRQQVADAMLAAAGIDPHRRPGTLSLVEWHELALAAGPPAGTP